MKIIHLLLLVFIGMVSSLSTQKNWINKLQEQSFLPDKIDTPPNQELDLINHYEYREMRKIMILPPSFIQMDLYFFKQNSYQVGLKIRCGSKLQGKEFTGSLQIKMMKNTKEINEGKTDIQRWKKYPIDRNISIYTRQYMLQNPSIFNKQGNKTIENIVQQQLEKLNEVICEALRSSQRLARHMDQNQHLRDWLRPQNKLIDVFMVEKKREKGFVYERGQVRISSLYTRKIKPSFWRTISVQAIKSTKVKQQISKYPNIFKKNTSYPKLFQQIFSKVIHH